MIGRRRRRPLFFVAGLTIVAVFVFAGCGKKTRPVPPDNALPAPITDLRHHLDEKGVTLQWTIPQRTAGGERISYRIKGFEIWRAVVPEKDFCEGCPVTYEDPVIISVDEYRKRGSITYSAAVLRSEHLYFYKVRTIAGWQMSGPDSNTISFYWQAPLEAPGALQALPGDGEVHLAWKAPESLLDGTPYHGELLYQIFRSTDGENFALLHDNIAGGSFIDRAVVNDRQYLYKVRALGFFRKIRAGGLFSAIASASTADKIPPFAPQGVSVLRTAQGVRIMWETVAEQDLNGYRIYRQPAGTGSATLLGETGRTGVSFVDPAPPSEAVRYFITAIDGAQPANESQPSEKILLAAEGQ